MIGRLVKVVRRGGNEYDTFRGRCLDFGAGFILLEPLHATEGEMMLISGDFAAWTLIEVEAS